MEWVKQWDSGWEYHQAFDKNGRLTAEVRERHGAFDSDKLFDARLCIDRPYKDLGQYRSLETAMAAVERELDKVWGDE